MIYNVPFYSQWPNECEDFNLRHFSLSLSVARVRPRQTTILIRPLKFVLIIIY